MIKRILSVILALVTLVSVLSFSSCAKGIKIEMDEELKERFVYLIEESRELNTVFFGSGLPVYRRGGDLLADRIAIYQSSGLLGYLTVSEQSEYKSIDDIKAAAESVFSEKYLRSLYETAFDGVVLGSTGAYLRYHDDGSFLYQNINANDFGLNERIYDYSTMKIVAPSDKTYVNVSVESYSLSDKKRITVELSFSFERGNWYLDSPTY